MAKLAPKDECNGCEACLNICPNQAIDMELDDEGFYFPYIKDNRCVNCDLCMKTCPIINPISNRNIKFNDTKAYGGYLEDLERLKVSSSGGIWMAAAYTVIERGGVVFGTIFEEDFSSVKFVSAHTISEAEMMRGSKYLNARKGFIYNKVKTELETGKLILFTGLPCEIGGLLAFLKKEYENLVTCELICAGPTSYNVYYNMLDWLEKKHHSSIRQVSFRYKKWGWVPCSFYVEFTNGRKYCKKLADTPFGIGMTLAKRLSCYNCQYKGEKRKADISIGDFWCIDAHAKYYNEMGTSVIFARTMKGDTFLEGLKGVVLEAVNTETAIKGNRQQLTCNLKQPDTRKDYFSVLKSEGLMVAYKKFKPQKGIKQKIKDFLPAPLFIILRRLRNLIK